MRNRKNSLILPISLGKLSNWATISSLTSTLWPAMRLPTNCFRYTAVAKRICKTSLRRRSEFYQKYLQMQHRYKVALCMEDLNAYLNFWKLKNWGFFCMSASMTNGFSLSSTPWDSATKKKCNRKSLTPSRTSWKIWVYVLAFKTILHSILLAKIILRPFQICSLSNNRSIC